MDFVRSTERRDKEVRGREEDQEAFLPRSTTTEREDEDSSHFSDSELDSEKGLGARNASTSTTIGAWKSYLRLGVEVVMVLVILGLLFTRGTKETTSTPSTPSTPSTSSTPATPSTEKTKERVLPVPSFPKKLQAFLPNQKYLHDDMFNNTEATGHTLHNWIELSSSGRGYVSIDNADEFDFLPKPFDLNMNATHTTPVYMMSVFHQLHCLSYLAEHFRPTPTPSSSSSSSSPPNTRQIDETSEQFITHHSVHCFDYIRQSIMCSADTSLEGDTEAGPGWGSKHECVDYDRLLEWANEHTRVKWRNNGPDDVGL